jgi:hypothetical protein
VSIYRETSSTRGDPVVLLRASCRVPGNHQETSRGKLGKTALRRHSVECAVNRFGTRPELLIAEAAIQIRYNFDKTGSEISGEKTVSDAQQKLCKISLRC